VAAVRNWCFHVMGIAAGSPDGP